MTKRLIYLQFGFWKKLRSNDSVEAKRLFWDLYGALECSNIRADIPIDEWEGDKDDLLFYLLQNSIDGYGTKIEKHVPEKIQDALDFTKKQPIENLCAAYLLDEDTQACMQHSKQLGILCVNIEMIMEQQFVRGSAVLFDQYEKASDFEKCKKQLASPCNSLIIIDPYLFDKKHYVDTALLPLLDRLLPQSLSIPFHITIFSQPLNCLKWGLKEITEIEHVFPYFDTLIKGKRTDLTISFTLCHSKKTSDNIDGIKGDFHSRYIITNCLMVLAEDGVDLYGKNEKCGKWSRFTFVWPSLDDNQRKDIDSYYRWIEIASKNIKNPNKCLMKWGTDENRLFDLID